MESCEQTSVAKCKEMEEDDVSYKESRKSCVDQDKAKNEAQTKCEKIHIPKWSNTSGKAKREERNHYVEKKQNGVRIKQDVENERQEQCTEP